MKITQGSVAARERLRATLWLLAELVEREHVQLAMDATAAHDLSNQIDEALDLLYGLKGERGTDHVPPELGRAVRQLEPHIHRFILNREG